MSFAAPYKWNQVKPEYLLEPQLQGTAADVLHVLPLLCGITLNKAEFPGQQRYVSREDLKRNQ